MIRYLKSFRYSAGACKLLRVVKQLRPCPCVQAQVPASAGGEGGMAMHTSAAQQAWQLQEQALWRGMPLSAAAHQQQHPLQLLHPATPKPPKSKQARSPRPRKRQDARAAQPAAHAAPEGPPAAGMTDVVHTRLVVRCVEADPVFVSSACAY